MLACIAVTVQHRTAGPPNALVYFGKHTSPSGGGGGSSDCSESEPACQVQFSSVVLVCQQLLAAGARSAATSVGLGEERSL